MSTSSIIIIIANIVIAVILAVGLTPVFVWWERRISAFMQDRSGPNRCHIGPFRLGGVIQSFADMLKLVFKEDFTPSHIKYKFFFTIAPAIVFMCSFLTFAAIPYADVLVIDGKENIMQAIPNELGIMWFLAFAGLSVYGIILGGYSSGSKYGLLGSIRASAQVISYEAAMGLAIISMLLSYGSIHLTDIVNAQAGTYLGVVPMWGIFIQPLAAIIFIICAFAETNRAPFDLAEGESELVAGYHTEYSAMRFGLFQVGEYSAMSASSAIIVTLFFGGYQIPWLDTQAIQSNMNYIIMAIIILLPIKVFFLTKWMKKNSECIYGCDYAGWEKQDWGYYTRKSNQVYMVVFNPPYSGQLTVKTPKGITITTAKTLTGEQTQVTETTRNEYNVSLPKNMPQEPFVIKLEVKDAQKTQDKYREALT